MMMVQEILREDVSQLVFRGEDQVAETLLVDGSHEALRIGIQIGTAWGQFHGLHPGGFENALELGRIEWIPAWIRYFLPARKPFSPLILRAICSIQGPLGWACRPRISTLRVATSMAKSAMQRTNFPLTNNSIEKKSHAARAFQWLLMNSYQVVLRVRSGSGSKPFSKRIDRCPGWSH
jgi:hypothetical protein